MALKQNEGTETVVVRIGGKPVKVEVREGEVLLPKGMSPARRSQGVRRPGRARPASVSIKSVKPSTDYGPESVARRVIGVLGNNTVAMLLDVSKDRPGRWASGNDSPSEVNRAQLADLDALVGQMLTVFTPAQAVLWLNGQDPTLGARPLDVYRLAGTAPLIQAMKAHEQGAFA